MKPTQAIGHTVANTLSLTALSILATTLAEVFVVNKLMQDSSDDRAKLIRMGVMVVVLVVGAVTVVWVTGGDMMLSLLGVSSPHSTAAGLSTALDEDGI